MLVREMLKQLKEHGFHMAVVSRETGIDSQLLLRASKGKTELRESDINSVRDAHQKLVNKGEYLCAEEQAALEKNISQWGGESINAEKNIIRKKALSLFALINDHGAEEWAVKSLDENRDLSAASNNNLMELASGNLVHRYTDDQKLDALYEIIRRLRGNI